MPWPVKSAERGPVLPNSATVWICEPAALPELKPSNEPLCTPNQTGARVKPPLGCPLVTVTRISLAGADAARKRAASAPSVRKRSRKDRWRIRNPLLSGPWEPASSGRRSIVGHAISRRGRLRVTAAEQERPRIDFEPQAALVPASAG